MGLEKINDMRRSLGWGLDTLAEKSGVPIGTLSKISAGITKDPKLDTIKSIVHCMGYTLDDLDDDLPKSSALCQPPHYADLLDEYKAIVDATSEQAYKAQTLAFKAALVAMKEDKPDSVADNVIPFRLSDQPASAGHGFDLGPENFHNIKVKRGCLPRSASFGVPVSGDSMEPKYHDGDILIVDGQPVETGGIGVFTLNGDGYVKRLGNGELISLNPEYKPIKICESDYFRHNGNVIGVLDPDCIVE